MKKLFNKLFNKLLDWLCKPNEMTKQQYKKKRAFDFFNTYVSDRCNIPKRDHLDVKYKIFNKKYKEQDYLDAKNFYQKAEQFLTDAGKTIRARIAYDEANKMQKLIDESFTK